ncbi:MAG: DMT family transporter [Acidimicrobiia bacterium]
MRRVEVLAVGALTFVAFMFGTGYVVMQEGLDDVRPIPLIAIRFTVAAAALSLVGARRPSAPGEWRDGIAAGLMYLVGVGAMTLALDRTDASTVAFLVFLLVVTVPVLDWMLRGHAPRREVLVAVAMAVAGLILLSGGPSGFGAGEALAVVAAVAFGWHILQMGDAAARHDLARFNAIQCAAAAVPCLAAVPFTGGLPSAGAGWWVAVYAGLAITACTLGPWMWAQRHLPPDRTALILLSEPVFAAVADAVRGHTMSAAAVTGAALILAAAVVSETIGRRPVVALD